MVDLRKAVAARITKAPPAQVWTPVDFLDLGSRAAVDKVLQRLVQQGQLRRIDRGLYDAPRANRLTGQPAVADYRRIIDAIGRRDQLRMLVDGMTAANDLGLTTAVPARVVIHTDARRRAIRLDNLVIEFKHTAPSKLYWAGRPAMRIVQALHWLKDTLPSDRDRIMSQLAALLAHDQHGRRLRSDLRSGLAVLPGWMHALVRDLLSAHNGAAFSPVARASVASRKRTGPSKNPDKNPARQVTSSPASRLRQRGAPREPTRASPDVVVLGGPNGAGKSTAAPRLLRGPLRVDEFVNADTLAQGLSAFRPQDVAVEAGRITLQRLSALEAQRKSFAFESTLASQGLARRLDRLKQSGYRVHILYLWLPTVELALARVAARVRTGGHDVPAEAVRRRFERGRHNFFTLYRTLADAWRLYDATPLEGPKLIAAGGSGELTRVRNRKAWRVAAEGFES
jgi:predicted ABC-type ATPase